MRHFRLNNCPSDMFCLTTTKGIQELISNFLSEAGHRGRLCCTLLSSLIMNWHFGGPGLLTSFKPPQTKQANLPEHGKYENTLFLLLLFYALTFLVPLPLTSCVNQPGIAGDNYIPQVTLKILISSECSGKMWQHLTWPFSLKVQQNKWNFLSLDHVQIRYNWSTHSHSCDRYDVFLIAALTTWNMFQQKWVLWLICQINAQENSRQHQMCCLKQTVMKTNEICLMSKKLFNNKSNCCHKQASQEVMNWAYV